MNLKVGAMRESREVVFLIIPGKAANILSGGVFHEGGCLL